MKKYAVFFMILVVSHSFLYCKKSKQKVTKNSYSLTDGLDYSFKKKNSKYRISHEWYYYNVLSENYSCMFAVGLSKTPYIVFRGLDPASKIYYKRLKKIDESQGKVTFDGGSINHSDRENTFQYKDAELAISLTYKNYNNPFRLIEKKYMNVLEYNVFGPEALVKGKIIYKNKKYEINGIGNFDHTLGHWKSKVWIWGWIPNIEGKTLVFFYQFRNFKPNKKSLVIIVDKKSYRNVKNKIYYDGKLKIECEDFKISVDVDKYKYNLAYTAHKVDAEITIDDKTMTKHGIFEYHRWRYVKKYISIDKDKDE